MLCKCYVLSIPIPSDNAENKKFHVWNGYAHDSGPPPAPPPTWLNNFIANSL